MSTVGITKEKANEHLNAWLNAELAISTGQSYKIGSRELKRADLKEVRESIKFWQGKVQMLENPKRTSRNTVVRVIPRDL